MVFRIGDSCSTPGSRVAGCKPVVVDNGPHAGGTTGDCGPVRAGCPAVGVAGGILLLVAAAVGKCPVPDTLGNMPVRESRPAE